MSSGRFTGRRSAAPPRTRTYPSGYLDHAPSAAIDPHLHLPLEVLFDGVSAVERNLITFTHIRRGDCDAIVNIRIQVLNPRCRDPAIGGSRRCRRRSPRIIARACGKPALRTRRSFPERNPQAVYRIAYEDLLVDPANQLQRLQRWCGLDPDPAVVSYAKGRIYDNPPKKRPS